MQPLASLHLRLPQRPLRASWTNLADDRKLACVTLAALVCGMGFFWLFRFRAHQGQPRAQGRGGDGHVHGQFFSRPWHRSWPRAQTLSASTQAEISKLLSPASAGRPLLGFRIWVGETIVFSNDKTAIGKSFPSTPSSDLAWSGHVAAEFNQIDEDDEQVFHLPLPILEVYAPVRERGTGRIIALFETYEAANELEARIDTAQSFAWLLIGTSTLGIALLLLSVMRSVRLKHNSLAHEIRELLRMKADVEGQQRRLRRGRTGRA
jgi:hypothetical protein